MTRILEKTSIVWWLVIPVAMFSFFGTVQFFEDRRLVEGLLGESAPVEIAQATIMAFAFLASVTMLPSAFKTHNKFIIGLSMFTTLGAFYVTGEEISWGQHFFLWQTPNDWMAINDHHETNLHNTSSWLDEKPKVLLEIGMLVGTILLPVYRKYRTNAFVEKYAIVIPPEYLWVTATALWSTKIFKALDNHFHWFNLYRTSEINEIYIYYFLLIYILALKLRIKRLPTSEV